jgi:general secretion pathway protein L
VTPIILGVNLLPVENRRIKNNFNLKLNAGLALVLMVLIYFVMYTSIENKKQKIQTLTDINSELQKQARVSKLLKKDLKSVIVSSKFLQIKHAEHPKIVAMLSDVTAKLPDSTYLTKMKINQGEFEITGESENANILVPELNKSINWYAPHISGAITPNPVTKKERFTIKADLKEPQEEDDNGQS